jgi:phosphoribosylformimino-5-aminoimidazole carboxamide ribotide isomerase
MKIIPVLDLKRGKVVRARGGRRDEYAPIDTPLAVGASPEAVARGLRTLHPFDTFYLADLDAIAGGPPNHEAVATLMAMQGVAEVWIDAGFADGGAMRAYVERHGTAPALRCVVGSESQADVAFVRSLRDDPRAVLSLDFFADGFRGPAQLLEDTALWPSTVIAMTLARVGSGSGPDLERLRMLKSKAGERAIVAAGGIRNVTDLAGLEDAGVAAALVATALHAGNLTEADIAAVS